MTDKRSDLKSEQQRRYVEALVVRLADTDPSLYYRSTVDIAALIEAHIQDTSQLNQAERELMAGVDRRAIQLMLSLHGD
ncbi:MAG: hypothetical protein AAGF46_06785 [Pseudomonadota bacterium]